MDKIGVVIMRPIPMIIIRVIEITLLFAIFESKEVKLFNVQLLR